MDQPEMQAKLKEIHEALAKQTGVSVADVAKVVNYLGLEGAISNRFSKIGAHADPRLRQVSLDTIRLSAGPSPSP